MSGKLFAIVFPITFVGMWLAVSALLGAVSGWYGLMAQYPDRPEPAAIQLRGQSGTMGFGVRLNGILNVSACRSGLRVGIWRIFGPFCRDFFVPWADIKVERQERILGKTAKLSFGWSQSIALTIQAHVADRLALAVPDVWPERGPIVAETRRETLIAIFRQWAMATAFAALFFTVIPWLATPGDTRPPVAVTILFPALVFGVFSIFQYFRRVAT